MAAGLSRRMGAPKLRMPLGDRPLLAHVVSKARRSGCAPVVVVTSEDMAPDVRRWAAEPAASDGEQGPPQDTVQVVVNPAPARGLSLSLALGIRALPPDIDAGIIVLGDQPLLPPDIFARLTCEHRLTGAPIVAPVYGGRRGHPVLFARRLFPELLAVTGDRGARDVLARYEDRIRLIPVDDPLAGADVDTPADLKRLQRRYAARKTRKG